MGKRLIVRILFNAFIFCVISVLASEPSYGLTVINVELASVRQKIEGFGGNGAFAENWLSSHPKKQEIYNLIFGGLGTSIYRIRNSYEVEFGIADMQRQAEAVQAAAVSLEHPVKVMISSWTPPSSLKNPASEYGGTLARYYPNGPYKYEEFAQWWADSLTAYKQLGITPTYITIQNEPNISVWHASCKFTPIETDDWAGYDRALYAVYQELYTMQEPPKILAPDTTTPYQAGLYIDAILNKAPIYGFAHHLYGTGSVGTLEEKFDNPDSFIWQMQTFRNNYGYKPIFQTEYCRLWDSDGFREAINTARHIHNSLVEENVASYMVWGLFWPKDIGEDGLGLVLIDNPWSSNPGYTIRDTYYAFKHYSKFIPPDYRRVNISDPKVSGLRASAFKSPDEDTVVLVIINPQLESISFSVSGLDAYGLCQVYRTDSSPNNNCTNINYSFDGNLPGNSITTLIYNNSCNTLFTDVPPGHWAEDAINKIYNAGITKGCSEIPSKFCPYTITNREQMAVFLGRGEHGSQFTPPDATGIFADVDLNHWAADWIEQAYRDGITQGCNTSPLKYCPTVDVTRAQMAVFLLRAMHGGSYTPPKAAGIFSDVDLSNWAAPWIEQLYNENITVGCGTNPLRYCPDAPVTRAQMAVFLMRTFGL